MQEMIWNIVWIECSILDFSPTASINPSHGRTDMCCYIYIYLYIYNYVHFCLSIYMYYCRLIERYLEIYIYLYLGKRKVFVCVFVCFSSSFILCASLLIPKETKSKPSIRRLTDSLFLKENQNVKVISKWECGPGDKYRVAQKCAKFQIIYHFYS